MAGAADTSQAALELARRYAETLSGELAERLGTDVSVRDPNAQSVAAEQARSARSAAFARTAGTASGEPAGTLQLVVPMPDAVTLASLALGEPPERTAERRAGSLDEETLAAYGEVVGLIASRLAALLEEERGAPAFEVGETAPVADPSAEAWLDDGSYLELSFALALKGFDDGGFAWLIPEAVAGAWFEAAAGEASEGASAAAGGHGGHPAHDGERTVVFLEPDADERARLEGFEEPLAATVWALDPDEFGPESFDALAETQLVVVSWDLNGRPGLDVIESLHADERTRHLPLVLAAERPTRSLLRAGLRSGAASFVTRPYEAEEVAARLRPLLDAPPEGTPSQ